MNIVLNHAGNHVIINNTKKIGRAEFYCWVYIHPTVKFNSIILSSQTTLKNLSISVLNLLTEIFESFVLQMLLHFKSKQYCKHKHEQ